MARLPPSRPEQLNDLNSELDRLRQQMDAARDAFERRRLPDRRAHSRAAGDRRIVAAAADTSKRSHL